MAEDTQDIPGTDSGVQASDAAKSASFAIVGQYIRDLSFENPNAPGSLASAAQKPASNVSINVQVKKQSEAVYATEIGINVKTEHEGKVVYAVELVYGGLFRVQNVPENQLGALLMVEAPRLIFPFARQVLATTIQQGGFAPLMLEPVDFLALYRRNLQAATDRQKQQQAGDGTETDATPTVN